MAGTLRRRGAAVTALVLASGSLAALASAAPAGAAKNSAPDYYQGVTSANVLGVALHLPSALPALPKLPKDLAINLIGVNGNAVHNTLGTGAKTSSTAVSSLASGSLVEALPTDLGLSKIVKASLGQPAQRFTDIPIDASPLLKLDVGALTANAQQNINSSTSVLTNGTVAQLGQLLDVKAVTGTATTLIAQLQDQVDAVSGTVTDQVKSVLDQIDVVLNQTPSSELTPSATQTLENLQATLNQVLDTITNILANVGDTAVLSVKTLDASQSIAPAAGAAQALASVNLADLNVLNGLLTVKGFVSQATAVANGKPHGAKATFSGHAPIVQIGTPLLTATLDEAGLNLSGVTGLPADVTDQVNAALATLQDALNTLLGTLGVHLNYVPGHVDKVDTVGGRYAAATGPEYDIVVDSPVPGDGALAEIGLGHGTTASVSAQQATQIVKLPNPQQGALPHTGANLPLIGAGALVLMAIAGILRRRMV